MSVIGRGARLKSPSGATTKETSKEQVSQSPRASLHLGQDHKSEAEKHNNREGEKEGAGKKEVVCRLPALILVTYETR